MMFMLCVLSFFFCIFFFFFFLLSQLVHQDANKKHLTAEWVMPVMPDVSLWPNTYTTVMFDKDPAADDTVKGSEV